MNNANGGAASAVPSSPEEAEELLLRVRTPEQAYRLFLICSEQEGDWRAVKLKAEHRYGELLGPADTGAPKGNRNYAGRDNVASCDVVSGYKDARHRARLVAAVPQDKFDEYLRSTTKPTRAGLLRKYGPDQEPKKRKAGPTFAGKRRHQAKLGRTEAKRNGRPMVFWEIGWDVSRLVYAIAGWKVEAVDLSEDSIETMLTVEEDILYLYDWMDDTIELIHSRVGEDKILKRIEKLRAKTVDNGCTAEEAEAAERAARRLQRKIGNRLVAV